jgi:tetrahydromethanopterin S-methyltransferase subunit H
MPIVMGANFALYGPVKKAAELYPSIAFVDACIAYSMRQEFKIKPLTKDHPIFKIFR